MRSTFVRLLLPVVIVAGLAVPIGSADAAALPVKFLDCDTTYGNDPGEGSFRLGNNLDCPAGGLFIDGSNITVDLGGHRISGDGGTDNGLRIFTSENVTVKNGVIDDFDFNVIVGTSINITLQNLVLMRGNPATNGLEVQDGSGHRILNNTLVNDTALALRLNATDSIISGNTLMNSRIVVEADDSKITSNRVFGGAASGITINDGSEGNVIAGNSIVGASASGISVSGNDADDNVIKRNTVRAQTDGVAGEGILVTDADRTQITDNTASANRVGIATRGFVENTIISGNNVSANIDVGIDFGASNSTGRIVENVANENGEAGISAFFSTDALIRDNTANFNGYLNGLNDNSSPGGIVAPTANGGNNRARGNDVAGDECFPLVLCAVGPTTPPPLIACDVPLTAGATLRHPMVCGTQSAVRINGNGVTVNLSRHVVDGGSIGPQEAAVQVESSSSDVTIVGGVLVDSENGVNLLMPVSAAAHDITIRGSLILNNDGQGIFVRGQDFTPGSSTATAGRVRIERSTIGLNGEFNIFMTEAPQNVVTGNTLIGASGIGVERTVLNTVSGNTIIGPGGSGVVLTNNATTDFPTGNKISGNRIVGAGGRGVDLQGAVENTVSGNTIIGTGTNAGDGIRLVPNGAATGSQDNKISKNKVSGGAADGISLSGESSGNRISGNVFHGNHLTGIWLGSNAEANVLKSNRADENGADGTFAAGIFVSTPLDFDEESDVLVDNVAIRNGFLNEAAGDDVGLGISAASDTDGNGNVAKRNDDPDECLPAGFCG